MPPPVGSSSSNPPPPPPPPVWNLRASYRAVIGPQIGHGFQLAVTPTVRLSDGFRFAPTTEINLMPWWDGIRSDTVSAGAAGAAVGSPPRMVDGVGYTDIAGGTRDRFRLHHHQVVQYLNFFWRPSADVPFEMGLRLAFGFENVADRTTITATSASGPGHTGPGGCVPGDIHCSETPIPEPMAGPRSPAVSESDSWNFFMRGGFRLNFPFHPIFRIGAELLFQANTHTPTGPDPFIRIPATLTAPIHRNFQLQAEPRLIVRFVEPVVTFDLVAGAVVLF
jgi:hypothetical protein